MTYHLTPSAEDDYDSIVLKGILTYGAYRSEIYIEGLIQALNRIGSAPEHYQVQDIPSSRYDDIRIYTYKAHTIVFRIVGDIVVVGRIAYGTTDWRGDIDHHIQDD